MHLFTIAWRNLWRRRTRSGLTVCGLAVMIAAVVALRGVADGFTRSWLDLYNDRQVDVIVQRAGGGADINRMLSYSLRGQLEAIPGVHDVLPGQLDIASLPQYDLPRVLTVGWETTSRLLRRLRFTTGRSLATGDRRQVILGQTLAANTGLKPGDKLQLYDEDFNVIGVFQSPNTFENGSVIMPIDELQRLMNTKLVTAFSVSVEHPDDPAAVQEVARQIGKLDPTISALPAADFVGRIREIAAARAVSWAISAIALVIGAIGMLNTMAMSVFERMGEIGTLRALGWRKLRVAAVILYESFYLSVAGAAAGTLAALGLTRFLSHLPLTSGLIQAGIAPAIVAEGLLFAMLVGMGGGVYPAMWAARLVPTEAMRHK